MVQLINGKVNINKVPTPGGCKSVGGPGVGSSFLLSIWPAVTGEWEAAKVCTPDIAAVDTAGGKGRGTVLKADFNFCLGMSWIFGCRLAAVICVSSAGWFAVDVAGVDTTGLICRVLQLFEPPPPPKTVVVVVVAPASYGTKVINIL